MMTAGRAQLLIRLFSAALLAGVVRAAAAQPAHPPNPPPAPPAPQRTTATFGDWTLRCERPTGSAELCEIAQSLSAQGQTVAQIAIGHPARGEPLQLTVAVPPSVTLTQQPRLGGAGKDAPGVDLLWRRCLPGGCFAAASLPDDIARQLRARTEASRIVFLDGAGKEAALPFSPKGMTQAMEALTREEGS